MKLSSFPHVEIQRSIRQGFILSLLLFYLYSDAIFQRCIMGNGPVNLKVNEIIIQYIDM